MIKVCHLVRQYHPGTGGLESFVDMLAREQVRKGCACEVITLDRIFRGDGARLPSRAIIDGMPVRRINMVGHQRFFFPNIEASALAGYDVLHVHGIDGLFDRVARQPRRAGQIRVATSHGAIFHTPSLTPVKKLYFETATRAAAKRYNLVLANSTADKALMDAIGAKATLLANGVSPLGTFTATGSDLLYLGRLASHKRIDLLIDALAQPDLQGAHLHIVGPDWDVRAADLRVHAERRGVGRRVSVHGRLQAEPLADIARRCAAFVSASAYEGFGMSLIEAMSVGLIPVVEANASFKELICAAELGATTSYATAETAARAVRRQLDLVTEVRRNAARRFAARFSWDAHAETTIALYRKALRDQAKSAALRPQPA